jgi:hypothetical protein
VLGGDRFVQEIKTTAALQHRMDEFVSRISPEGSVRFP